MDYKQLAKDFIKQHEGVGYQSFSQICAIDAFAEWLEKNVIGQSAELTDCQHEWYGIDNRPELEQCIKCGDNRRRQRKKKPA